MNARSGTLHPLPEWARRAGLVSSSAESRALADRVNDIGRMNAVIHNAGAYLEAYAESKLHVTVLAMALARAWPDVLTNVVDHTVSAGRWLPLADSRR
jgi:hypothetical protein